MRLSDLKQHIESFPEGHIFKFGFSLPLPGSTKTAIVIDLLNESMTREDCLRQIETMLTGLWENVNVGARHRLYHTVTFRFPSTVNPIERGFVSAICFLIGQKDIDYAIVKHAFT